MTYHWVAEPDAAGVGLEQRFGTQADAEAWLTSEWEELADAGVRTVTLQDADRVVYGPMSLESV